jgi:hypothetical protein
MTSIVTLLLDVSINLLTGITVDALEDASIVNGPVLRPGTEDEPVALTGYGQPVSGTQPYFPEQMDRQGYLVLATDGAQHRFLLPSAVIDKGSFRNPGGLPHFTGAIFIGQGIFPLLL